jgi:hypothetical protein
VLTSGQTIVSSILNECINDKMSYVVTQQRATVSPQFYYDVLGIVKRPSLSYGCVQPFFIMVHVVCAYDSLECYLEVERSSFHVLTSSIIYLQDELQ